MSESILLLGDCLISLQDMPDNSIDSIVTDPPYGLSFMGKKWDYDVPSIEIWKECLRVLKPGGHLLSFGGTRTYHRLVVNIEDAGFEIRDCIQWLYGSGFPKSHNIKDGDFKGWGTALKPANEPICVARKPLEKGLTVADNVLKYGTGALNIGESRIENENKTPRITKQNKTIYGGNSLLESVTVQTTSRDGNPDGRWPANIILDEYAASVLDEQSGILTTNSGKWKGATSGKNDIYGKFSKKIEGSYMPSEKGGASRFFYVAKASKSERNKGVDLNNHPTVKPIKLMEYLIKLVTPQNGVTLDPFMGSGTTGVAAKALGFTFIGCEMAEEYMKIAEKRINNEISKT